MVNPAVQASIHLASELAQVAAELRRITVQVHCDGLGSGSGVIWSPGGLVVTNAHVVGGPRNRVTLTDGRELRAELLLRDTQLDLAALRVPLSDYLSARLRDPRSLRVGELVVAVGNPLGEVGALSVGLVHVRSARLLAADIRLAPGNSGGPLADVTGRVVGISSMVVDGLGVAVPSDVVQRFLSALPRQALAEGA